MLFFRNNPFIRLLIPLIVGIILQYYIQLNNTTIIVLAITSLVSFILFIAFKLPYNLRYLQGILLNYLLVCLGAIIVYINKPEFISIPHTDKIMLMGEIINVPEVRSTNSKTEIHLEAQKEGNNWKEIDATVIAYIEIKDSLFRLKAGNKIAFNTQLTDIQAQQNPFGFDFANYMALKNINESVYLKMGDWILISEETKGLKNKALNLRQKFIDVFEKHGIKGDNLAVLSALTLGYKNNLDAKVRQAYSGSGAMHVLSVSGLHVAIIYIVLKIILSWFAFFKKLEKVKFIIILFALWGFAFLTGLSPSVMRATIMFSFVVAGQILDKKVSIYNSLAASCFFILLESPLLVFDVGFQLSYIAVLGIVFFYPIIYGWLNLNYRILNALWSLTAVSIAATLATFPIIVYNFHQFPTYFWLSNIEVSFSAFALIIISIVLIIFSALPIISGFIALALNSILTINLNFLNWINELPGAVLTNISFSAVQVFLLYGLILVFAIWLVTKKYAALITWLSCILILEVYAIQETHHSKNQNAICVYQLRDETAIQLIHQNQSIWMTSKNDEKSKINSVISEGNIFWKAADNKYYEFETLTDTIIKQKIWYFNSGFWATPNYKGLVINTLSKLPGIPKDTLFIDYIFVTGYPSFTLRDLSGKIKYKKVIIDGSVPFWKAKQFVAEKSNASLYYTKEQGAFISGFDL